MTIKPAQKILFGSPGTGKSHKIKNTIAPELKIEVKSENYIPTVFHPEYTYGDFMGKLMPFTNDSGKVEYLFYRGHFLKALAQAYKNIIITYIEWEDKKEKIADVYKKEIEKTAIKTFSTEEKHELERRQNAVIKQEPQNVLLVIDEINRGNSAAIFGTVFQLLDRESNGWSTYPISISDLEFKGLVQEMSFKYEKYTSEKNGVKETYTFNGKEVNNVKDYEEYQNLIFQEIEEEFLSKERKIKIPSNLSIVATMNTSDNSIYFMDNAFKRRWDWQFVNIDDDDAKKYVENRQVNLYGEDVCAWHIFVERLNKFILSKHKTVRKIEDKQIGYFFINEHVVTDEHIKNKLMFFIWDSVFNTSRQPLLELLNKDENDAYKIKEEHLVTFGQFTQKNIVTKFVQKIIQYQNV